MLQNKGPRIFHQGAARSPCNSYTIQITSDPPNRISANTSSKCPLFPSSRRWRPQACMVMMLSPFSSFLPPSSVRTYTIEGERARAHRWSRVCTDVKAHLHAGSPHRTGIAECARKCTNFPFPLAACSPRCLHFFPRDKPKRCFLPLSPYI